MNLLRTRSRRIGAVVFAIFLWAVAAVVIAVSPSEPGLFGTLLLVGLSLVFFAAHESRHAVVAAQSGRYRNVLKKDLQAGEFSELGGVQYVALPFPDRGSISDPMVLL